MAKAITQRVKETSMFTKILVAAAALTAAVVMTAPAQAKNHFDVSVGIGLGGFYGDDYYGGGYYPVYGGYDSYDGVSCWKAKKILQNHGFYKVHATDCGGKYMHFMAKKDGYKVYVTVNRWGKIVDVDSI
jgi:hypothetical protein